MKQTQLAECERRIMRTLDCSWDARYDGGHHKQWVIDQMVRCLTGDDYDSFVKEYNSEHDEPWDVGIAP